MKRRRSDAVAVNPRPVKKARRQVPVTMAQVKRMIETRQEHKYWPVFQNSTAGSSGSIVSMANVPQGDTTSTRDGDQLRLIGIELRFSCVTADSSNIVRFIIFQYHNSGTPTLAEILDLSGTGSGVDHLAPYSMVQPERFTILRDVSFGVSTNNPNPEVPGHVRIAKGFNPIIKYDAGATTGQGLIWSLVISDSLAVTHPSYTYNGRLIYSDS